jgi:hypothetical protein
MISSGAAFRSFINEMVLANNYLLKCFEKTYELYKNDLFDSIIKLCCRFSDNKLMISFSLG